MLSHTILLIDTTLRRSLFHFIFFHLPAYFTPLQNNPPANPNKNQNYKVISTKEQSSIVTLRNASLILNFTKLRNAL